MEKQKSIQKNMIMNIILTVSNFVFPIITYSYVARVLTPTGVGKVIFANSVIQYFLYIAVLGIPAYGLRECAKFRDDRQKLSHLVQELFIISLIATVIAYAALGIAILLVPKLHDYKNILLVMSAYIFLNTIGFEWLYKALEEYSYITIRSLIFKTVSAVLTFVLIKTQEDYLWYGFLLVLINAGGYVFNLFGVHKFITIKKEYQYDFKRHLKPILTLFAASVVITIYGNFDVSMLGFIDTEDQVGLYNSVLQIKNALLSVSTAVTSVLIPRIAYYIMHKDETHIKQLIANSIRVSMDLALPLAGYCLIFAEYIILFICGKDYLEAVDTLRILVVCIVPLIMSNVLGQQILIPTGREKRYSQSVFIGMWINVALNLLMIPFWGAAGAAIGTLITECWNVLWMFGGAKDYKDVILKQIGYHVYVVALIAGSGIGLLVNFFLPENMNIFWKLVFTAGGYMIAYYAVLLACKEPLLVSQLRWLKERIHTG